MLLVAAKTPHFEAAEVKNLDHHSLMKELNSVQDSNKILFLFTSWCPHCKNTMSDILSLDENKHKKVFFLSLDDNPSHVQRMASGIKTLQTLGIKYDGSVPHMSVLDPENSVIQHNINTRQLYRYLK